MKHLLFGGARLDSAIGDVGLLILRVFAGMSLALGLSLAAATMFLLVGAGRLSVDRVIKR
jgi:hypothetical protein